MERLAKVEAALVWAKQQGYSMGGNAATEYANATGTVWEIKQSYYGLWGFRDVDDKPSLEARLAAASASGAVITKGNE